MLQVVLPILILVVQTSDPSDAEMERFWKSSAYVPSSVNQIVGRWSFSGGFESSAIEFAENGTFVERTSSDVITRESMFIEALTGRYRWNRDTLLLSYVFCVLKPSTPDSDRTRISAVMNDQLEWRTFSQGKCYIRQVERKLFLVRVQQKRAFSYWYCKAGIASLVESTLMKVQHFQNRKQ